MQCTTCTSKSCSRGDSCTRLVDKERVQVVAPSLSLHHLVAPLSSLSSDSRTGLEVIGSSAYARSAAYSLSLPLRPRHQLPLPSQPALSLQPSAARFPSARARVLQKCRTITRRRSSRSMRTSTPMWTTSSPRRTGRSPTASARTARLYALRYSLTLGYSLAAGLSSLPTLPTRLSCRSRSTHSMSLSTIRCRSW